MACIMITGSIVCMWRIFTLMYPGRCQVFICKLSARSVDIFSTAYPESYIYTVCGKVIHKFLGSIFIGFYKSGIVYGIVFNNIYKMCRHLFVYFYKVISIRDGIIFALE